MTDTKSRKIQAGYEPIPGYTLEQLIGQGGFGEVWRADAPGGIKKAVKFVFGATEQHRATRELRSLERIKGVHHPFLLTLERFEIVDDQLVIITELADGSLEDVYNRHRERGSCGIPRAALLAYLHDAADALDYLHKVYQLQHLDIKPGNLLLVGGHVKVADFGLLKDLRDDDCSVIGGLTPTYAPPEVFDGRPSMHSDQYSLAVMYQELLSGTRPFGGRTIAQLATQHVNSAPDLESLPPSDRPIVARALEKTPERRFESCCEFIDALRTPRGRVSVTGFGDGGANGDTLPGGLGYANGSPDGEVQDLPQIKTDATRYLIRVTGHALVVGLGGSGMDCLYALRKRVGKLSAASPLDLHSVLIDTDPESIYATTITEAASGVVPPCQTIYTPLRSPTEYRGETGGRLASMSRRWIYNVPRSKRTEGMRPLGRLALVDHADEIKQTLRQAIFHLAAVCGERTPHVYLVGSLCGGTASGMFIDVAHLLRDILDEARLEHADVLPVLVMPGLRINSEQPLALHDTCAALAEIRHFLQPGNSFPGDSGAGIPSVPAARTPFRNTYVVACNPQQPLAASVETVVDYIWADATGAGELLAASRRTDGDAQSTQLAVASLRSVGVIRLGGIRGNEESLLAPATVRTLFFRWLGRPAEARQTAVPLADRLMRRCGLTSESIAESYRRLFGPDPESRRNYLVSQLKFLPPTAIREVSAVHNQVLSIADDTLGSFDSQPLLASLMVQVNREIGGRMLDRRADVTSSIEAIRILRQRCLSQSEQLLATPLEPGAEADGDQVSDKLRLAFQSLVQQLDAASLWGEISLEHAIRRRVALDLAELEKQLAYAEEQLEQLAARLAQGINHLNQDMSKGTPNPWESMPPELASKAEMVLAHLHHCIAPKYLSVLTSSPMETVDGVMMAQLIQEVTSQTIKRLVENLAPEQWEDAASRQRDQTDQAVASGSTKPLQPVSTNHIHPFGAQDSTASDTALPEKAAVSNIRDSLAAVRPALLACGGRQRLILIVGNEAERAPLERAIRNTHTGGLTVGVIPGMTPMLIHEAQQIKIDEVIRRVLMISAGNRQVTQRLHSRSDVAWDDIPVY